MILLVCACLAGAGQREQLRREPQRLNAIGRAQGVIGSRNHLVFMQLSVHQFLFNLFE